jgi:hypothetical protein
MNIINDIERYEFDKVDITIISDIFYNGQTQAKGDHLSYNLQAAFKWVLCGILQIKKPL